MQLIDRRGYKTIYGVTVVAVNRMPKVDHAVFSYNDKEYNIIMQNDKNYCIDDDNSDRVAEIVHRGISGGWNIDVSCDFPAAIICAIFIACRYIEQENEFMIL